VALVDFESPGKESLGSANGEKILIGKIIGFRDEMHQLFKYVELVECILYFTYCL
jgi:hypothetical protein